MIIIPAIDLKEGKVVRLSQGQFDKVTEYSNDPIIIAQDWVSKGAQRIHLVDLDGAQKGIISNISIIAKLAKYIATPIQMGGGIRTKDDIVRLLESGIQRVILGTKAIEDRNFLKDILREWPDQIAVSVDCAAGMVTYHGWVHVTELKAAEFARELESLGLKCLIYTDIARDGMLTGPNIPALKEILEAVNIPVIASGGIFSIDDIRKLLELQSLGLAGAITGKALYEGTLDLEDAIELCSQNE